MKKVCESALLILLLLRPISSHLFIAGEDTPAHPLKKTRLHIHFFPSDRPSLPPSFHFFHSDTFPFL